MQHRNSDSSIIGYVDNKHHSFSGSSTPPVDISVPSPVALITQQLVDENYVVLLPEYIVATAEEMAEDEQVSSNTRGLQQSSNFVNPAL